MRMFKTGVMKQQIKCDWSKWPSASIPHQLYPISQFLKALFTEDHSTDHVLTNYI